MVFFGLKLFKNFWSHKKDRPMVFVVHKNCQDHDLRPQKSNRKFSDSQNISLLNFLFTKSWQDHDLRKQKSNRKISDSQKHPLAKFSVRKNLVRISAYLTGASPNSRYASLHFVLSEVTFYVMPNEQYSNHHWRLFVKSCFFFLSSYIIWAVFILFSNDLVF